MASESTSTTSTPPQQGDPSLSNSGGLPPPVSHGKKVSLNILSEVLRSQQQFGLRHDDYQRYRKYCSRRLTRLRKSLKFNHQSGAKGTSAFQKKPVEPHMVTDERFFLLVIFRCERAWAYSMQLKQDMEIQTNNSRLIHHHLRRLDKAGKYAQALERIAIRGDEHTLLQATAYAGYMQGIVAQERELWEAALTHLSKASAIYSKLGVISGAETNKLCKEKEEAIDQRIRYCIKYLRKSEGKGEIKNEETKSLVDQYLKGHADLISKLDSVGSSDKLSSTAVDTTISGQAEVSWKGQRVAVQNEKLKAILLGTAQKLAQDIENSNTDSTLETKLPLFEQLFAAYADAMKLIKEEITALQKTTGKGKAKDPQELTLQSLQEYVTYLKSLASVQRSMMLADSASTTAVTDIAPVPTAIKKKHPDEMARLYEGVIHGMEELEAQQQGTTQDADEGKVFSGRLTLCKASRCYWLAMSHASLQNTDKALALFERAVVHSELASSAFTSTSRTTAQDRERLSRLMNDITAARAKARARAFLATLDAQTKQTPSKSSSLISGINTYDASFLAEKNLTDFPPGLEAIPCKPLLFDLALNDCSFPNLEARKKPQQAKSGWFGGLWGR